MKTNNHPNWLIPLEIARKLTKIGMTGSEIFIYNDGSYGWCKSEQMYDNDRRGDFYTAEEIYEFGNSKMEYTYTWEQVFEWFRNKGYKVNIDYVFHPDLKCKIGYLYEIIYDFNWESYNSYFETYEIAREECLKKLIEIYDKQRN